MSKKKHPVMKCILLSLLLLAVVFSSVFLYFGGLGVGESADPDEVKKYAMNIEDIIVPDSTRVIALGEATHGNAEFQELKLDVFKILVERYDVKAFVLEGDFGGCEAVNRYIHGGEGSAKEAAASIGFPIYRTNEMAELIEWMREYNNNAKGGEELRFYGNDMQLCTNNCRYLAEAASKLGIETAELLKLADASKWNESYSHDERVKIVTEVKAQLENKGGNEKDIHFADILLQNLTIGGIQDDPNQVKMMDKRAEFMTENVMWVLKQEEELGNGRIFVSAHNGHVARYESVFDMGSELYKTLGDQYFVIGTGYCKTKCNLPVREPSGERTTHTVFSHDPIGNAVNKADIDICYLDFSKVPDSSSLYHYISDYHYMGSLGESFSLLNRVLPMSTRIFQPPAALYNAMIYVASPTPTVIE